MKRVIGIKAANEKTVHLTKASKTMITEMYESGNSIYKICLELGIYRWVVEKILVEEGLLNVSECKYNIRKEVISPFDIAYSKEIRR